jgi:hypothetical protein
MNSKPTHYSAGAGSYNLQSGVFVVNGKHNAGDIRPLKGACLFNPSTGFFTCTATQENGVKIVSLFEVKR